MELLRVLRRHEHRWVYDRGKSMNRPPHTMGNSSDPAAGAELVCSHGFMRDSAYSKSTPQPFFTLLKIIRNVA